MYEFFLRELYGLLNNIIWQIYLQRTPTICDGKKKKKRWQAFGTSNKVSFHYELEILKQVRKVINNFLTSRKHTNNKNKWKKQAKIQEHMYEN